MVVEIEDAEPFKARSKDRSLPDDLCEKAEIVERFGSVEFGDFHTYRSDDVSN